MLATLSQLLVNGVLLGGIYALAAFGLALIFGVSNVLNLAHGEFLMLGALISYLLFASLGLNPILLGILLLPLFLVVGCLFEKGLIRRIGEKAATEQITASVLITLGAALTIEDLSAFLWGPTVKGISYSLAPLTLGKVVISSLRLLILGVIVLLTVAITLLIKHTYFGKALRALTQNRKGALLTGVNIPKITMLTFGLGISLAALAGLFYVILFEVSPFIGIPLTMKYLSIIVLGGLGSLYGALLGGMIIGLSEAFTGFYIGAHWAATVAFFILIAILLIRPQGLFGRAEV